MPARRVAEGFRSPLEHPDEPPISPFAHQPISPFAHHAATNYSSDASSCDDAAPVREPLFRTKGSLLDRAPSPDRWSRRHPLHQRRSRASIWLVTLPAFFVLLVVASVVPRDRAGSLEQRVEWQPQKSLGAQAIRSLSESLHMRSDPDPEAPVRVFADLFEVGHKPLHSGAGVAPLAARAGSCALARHLVPWAGVLHPAIPVE